MRVQVYYTSSVVALKKGGGGGRFILIPYSANFEKQATDKNI